MKRGARNSLLILNSKQTKDRYALSYKVTEAPTIRLISGDGHTALTDRIVFDKATTPPSSARRSRRCILAWAALK